MTNNLSERLEKHTQAIREEYNPKEVGTFLNKHQNLAPMLIGNYDPDEEENEYVVLYHSIKDLGVDNKILKELIDGISDWTIKAGWSTLADDPNGIFDDDSHGDQCKKVAKKLGIPLSKLGVIEGTDENQDLYDYYKHCTLELMKLLKLIGTKTAKDYMNKLQPIYNKVKDMSKYVVCFWDVE